MSSGCLLDSKGQLRNQTRHGANQTSNVLDLILVCEDNFKERSLGSNWEEWPWCTGIYAAKEKMNQKRQYKYDMNEVDFNQMRQLFNDVICESMTPMDADQFWNYL